jgi:hypothetical protein
MQPVDGAKVTCLTLGGLRTLPLAGNIERCCIEAQSSAEVIVPTLVGKDGTLEPTGAKHSMRDGEAESRLRCLAHLGK